MKKYGPRSFDGGIDQVPLPDASGELWLCGKHAIGPDVDAALVRANDSDTVVCLNERHELEDRYPEYVVWLDASDSERVIWHPIPDLHVPTLEEAHDLVGEIVRRVTNGRKVLVHCAAGIGRTGTTATMVLIALGLSAADALEVVGASRPMAGPEVGAQSRLVERYAAELP